MTKNTFRLTVLVIFGVILASCCQENKVFLFNGDNLDNWTKHPSDTVTDMDEIFQARDGIIYISGVPNGYLLTKESYSNYKLHVEWRWPADPTNNGVLLHCQGIDQPFPHCIEAQLKHDNAGDFVLMHEGAGIKVGEDSYIIAPGERWAKGIKKPGDSSENPTGEWNVYEITCQGDNIELIVNGVLQNTGSNANPSSGQIALQSEGGPIEFRNIYIVPQPE